ncbi:hypothetical protein HYV83_03675 [Candidatus Woesearchaeota archaeon]|nr:hypothetical protein [Candidatus Woesearchaeota archaeon]
MPDEKKKPRNIEELIKHFAESATADHKKNIKSYEQYLRPSNQARIERQLVHTAFEGNARGDIKGAYHRFEEQADTLYKDGKVDVKDPVKLQRAIAAYIVGYFEHAKPSVLGTLPKHLKEAVEKLKAHQEIGKEDVKSLYETLARHFDEEVGAGQIEGVQRVSGLEETIKKTLEGEEEVTPDMLKQMIYGFLEGHKKGAMARIDSAAHAAYIAHLPQGVYAAHVLEKIQKTGRKISPAKAALFHALPTATIASELHVPIAQRREDDVKYKKHGFYLPEPKERAA